MQLITAIFYFYLFKSKKYSPPKLYLPIILSGTNVETMKLLGFMVCAKAVFKGIQKIKTNSLTMYILNLFKKLYA